MSVNDNTPASFNQHSPYWSVSMGPSVKPSFSEIIALWSHCSYSERGSRQRTWHQSTSGGMMQWHVLPWQAEWHHGCFPRQDSVIHLIHPTVQDFYKQQSWNGVPFNSEWMLICLLLWKTWTLLSLFCRFENVAAGRAEQEVEMMMTGTNLSSSSCYVHVYAYPSSAPNLQFGEHYG